VHVSVFPRELSPDHLARFLSGCAPMSKIRLLAACVAAVIFAASCGDRRLSPSSPSPVFAPVLGLPSPRQTAIGTADYHENPVEVVPVTLALAPEFGDVAGGETVTITALGFDFFDGATVSFGAVPATGVALVDAQTMTAVTPPGVEGWVDLVVTNPNGVVAFLPGGFTYVAPRPPGAPAQFVVSAAGVRPKVIAIDAGSTVTFVNNDSRNHDVRSNPHPVHIDCQQINEVGFLPPGASAPTGAFPTPRVCGFHDHVDFSNTTLEGRVIIKAPALPLP
jgi:hypothetical protein